MKITYQPLRNPLYPWKIVSEEVYTLSQTSRGAGPDNPFWHIDLECAAWLKDLPEARRFFKDYPAAKFDVITRRNSYMPHGDARMVFPMPKIPPILLARKSDVLMFKLAWGGRR